MNDVIEKMLFVELNFGFNVEKLWINYSDPFKWTALEHRDDFNFPQANTFQMFDFFGHILFNFLQVHFQTLFCDTFAKMLLCNRIILNEQGTIILLKYNVTCVPI